MTFDKNNVEDFFYGHPTIEQDHAIEIVFVFSYIYSPLSSGLKYWGTAQTVTLNTPTFPSPTTLLCSRVREYIP